MTGAAQQLARGAAFGLIAAALFGLSAPLAKLLLASAAPLWLASLFYLGSGVLLAAYRFVRPATTESPLRREDLPTLAGLALLGGMLGPVLMLWGLEHVSGLTGSLLLNLEAPFTMLVAVLLFREHMGGRALVAAICILAGALALRSGGTRGEEQLLGTLAIVGACAAWAIDNNLTQRLSTRDPFSVVAVKALAAGSSNLALALSTGQRAPSWAIAGFALVVGSLSYGASVVLDAYALRYLGAAREAAFFATAPFIGAISSMLLLGDAPGPWDALAMLLMITGVVLLIRERHGHRHVHEAMAHEHKHVHDAHHQHVHDPGDPPGEPHSHPHRHEPLEHDHPHLPDLHHRHRH